MARQCLRRLVLPRPDLGCFRRWQGPWISPQLSCDASRVLVTRFEVTDGHHLGHPMNEATSQLLDRSGQVAIVTGG